METQTNKLTNQTNKLTNIFLTSQILMFSNINTVECTTSKEYSDTPINIESILNRNLDQENFDATNCSIDIITSPSNQKVFFPDMKQQMILDKDFFILDRIAVDADRLIKNDIIPPTAEVISKTKYLLKELAKRDVFATNISPTVEEGIMLKFSAINIKLYFELYNSGEMAFAIENITEKKVESFGMIHNIPQAIDKICKNISIYNAIS